jgi:hypothetical protein
VCDSRWRQVNLESGDGALSRSSGSPGLISPECTRHNLSMNEKCKNQNSHHTKGVSFNLSASSVIIFSRQCNLVSGRLQ